MQYSDRPCRYCCRMRRCSPFMYDIDGEDPSSRSKLTTSISDTALVRTNHLSVESQKVHCISSGGQPTKKTAAERILGRLCDNSHWSVTIPPLASPDQPRSYRWILHTCSSAVKYYFASCVTGRSGKAVYKACNVHSSLMEITFLKEIADGNLPLNLSNSLYLRSA